MGPAEPTLSARMRLIDSHAHLQADAFVDDADAVFAAAAAAGVERLLDPGWDVASSSAALELAGRHAWVDAAVGVHPHVASQVDDAGWSVIVGLASDARVVAIGETGLDYDRAFSPRPAQLANLRRNLALALATRKPAVIHCRSAKGARDAQDELIDELRLAGVGGEAWREAFGGGHPPCSTRSPGRSTMPRRRSSWGSPSVSAGWSFVRGRSRRRPSRASSPLDRLLVETDSPYLSPPGAPRRRNEPSWVAVTARWLAEQRGQDPVALGDQLVANYDRIFRRSDARADPDRHMRLHRRDVASPQGGRAAMRQHDIGWIGAGRRPFHDFTVGSLVPVVFERYARLLHPAWAEHGIPVRWATVATWAGREIHALAQWDLLSRPKAEPGAPAPFVAEPRTGGLPAGQLAALCALLRAHTATADQAAAADHCFIGVWEGYGWLADSEWSAAPALVLDQRTFLVRSGPLELALTLGFQVPAGPFVAEPPTLLWPADRAWFVASDPDLDSTYVGGSAVLIESLLHVRGAGGLARRA